MRKLLALVLAGAMLTAFAGTVLAVSDDDLSNTQVVVNSMITIDAPALLDFGSGVPGDVKTLTDEELLVTTNNDAGYTVTSSATALTSGTSADTIAAPTLTIGAEGTTAARSAEAGDTVTFDASLTIPFVDSGTYTGTATFTATTN